MRLPRKNWLEWIVFGVASVLVVGTLGFLIYRTADMGDGPPVIEATVGPAERRGAGFALPVQVTNTGDQSADEVTIEITVHRGASVEQAELAVGLLPRRSRRQGWVQLAADPGGADSIAANVRSYREP